jgi:Ribbon-helix-helix domain
MKEQIGRWKETKPAGVAQQVRRTLSAASSAAPAGKASVWGCFIPSFPLFVRQYSPAHENAADTQQRTIFAPSRSIWIGNHKTSARLEPTMWAALKHIPAERGKTVH